MSQVPIAGGGNGRELVEYAVTHLIALAPSGWDHLHVECAPPGVVTARLTDARGTARPLTVPAGASRALLQHRLDEVGLNPSRLVVDCFADGRLSAVVEPDDTFATRRPGRRWPRRALLALMTTCLVAAAAVFALGWRWSAPPIADIDSLAPLPPRQQQAFDLVNQWFRALNARDDAAVQALKCSNPTGAVLNDVEAMQGDYLSGIDYPEALVDFRDRGANVAAKVLLRTKPLTELEKQDVAKRQSDGSSGLAHRWIVLVEEAGSWKVCGSE